MITLYLWDEQGIHCGEVQADPRAALPRRSTPTAPPAVTGAQVAQWAGTKWHVLDALPASADPLPGLAAQLIAANNTAYEQAIGQLTADYPASEIATWERQRAEVLAWADDPLAPTPWIDTAAAVRGLGRDEYLARTLAKVHAFARASAYLTGRRQGIDDAIRAATTAEELAAVSIDYALPL